ncbi:MAG: TonB-dependent receptor [Caldithrix sp.]|nr:TonB-dependent receptor [Caldithrix sp.]
MRWLIIPSILGIITLFINPLNAETRAMYKIQGVIVNADQGQPLQGVNVYVQGTHIGTTSDRQGFYKLPELPAGHYTIYFSYVGFSINQKEVALNQDRRIDVRLSQDVLTGPLVTVEATQARERISPVTFDAIDRRAIEKRYPVQDIPEIISELPSTTFYSESGNGLGYNYLSIRGFDQRRISVMVNGIPQNDPEDHNVYWVDFPDFASNVQSIQVQRGAGSSFYGPAAIGGSINIKTNYFSPKREIKMFYGQGSYNTQKLAASYNSGLLNDHFVLYTRVSKLQSDGYRDRAWVDFWSYFLGAALYTENHNVRFHFYGGPIKDGLAYGGVPKSVNDNERLRRKNYSYWYFDNDSLIGAERRDDEIENFNQPHLELLHEYKFSSDITLNNNLFYIKGYGFFDYDGSWSTPDYYRLTERYGYNVRNIPADALIRAYVDNNQLGWLPQLTYSYDRGELLIGAELRTHRSLHWGRLQKGSGLPDEVVGEGARRYYEYKGGKDIASIYLHQNSKIWPRTRVMADLQYSFKQYHLYDEKFIGTEFELPYHFVNPRLGINFNATSRINAYVSLSSTQREPRLKNFYDAAEASSPDAWGTVEPQFEVNADGSYDFSKPLVKPETLTGLEFGLNYQSSRLRLGANFYYMDFKNEIIKKGSVDRFGQPITGNADRTVHKGIEWTSALQLHPRLMISGNLSLSRNELTDYSVYEYDLAGNATEIKLDGNPIAGFPDIIANLRLSYSWMDVYASLEARYQGKQYTDNFKTEVHTVDPFTNVDFNIRYRLALLGMQNMVLQARMNNILNNRYMRYGIGPDFFPAAGRNAFISLQYEL